MSPEEISREEMIALLMGVGYDVSVEYATYGAKMPEVTVRIQRDGARPREPGSDEEGPEGRPEVDIFVSAYVWDWETIGEAESRCFKEIARTFGLPQEDG